MRSALKNYACGLAIAIFISLCLFSQTGLEKIEMQLSKAKGKEKITLLSELIEGYRETHPQKLLQFGNEALILLKDFPDKKVRAVVLNNMSIAYRLLRDYKNAREYAQSSLSTAEQIDDKPATANALNSLGKVSNSLEEFKQALEYYSKSAKLFEEVGDQNKLALAYNSIAAIHWKLSDYTTAMEYIFNSLKIYEELGDQGGIAWINNNLGLLYWHLKDMDKSLEHHRKSLAIKKELNDKKGMATSLLNIGMVFSHQNKYDAALEYFQSALKICEQVEDKSLSSNILINMGNVYKGKKDDQQALRCLNRALKIKEDLNEKKGIANVLTYTASVNLRLGNHQEALQQAAQALDLAQQLNIKAEIGESYLVLSQAYEAMGDLRNALDYHKKYKEIDGQIFDDDTARRIAGLEVNFQIERREKEIELLRKDRQNQKTVLVFIILFAFLILVLAFVLYTRYRLKARVTRELEKEIDERKLTEQKLRESEEKFRVLAEKAVVGIWIIRDKLIKYVNPKTAEIFNYPPGELIDKNPLELTHEEDRPIMLEHLVMRKKGNSTNLSYQFRGMTKDGKIIELESYGALILWQGQPAILESVIDITRRKKTEAELIKSRKMESVGILAGGIAHDFNNLLAVIVGNTSMLKLNCGNDPRFYSFVDNVEKASAQAADLAQKFITFSEGGWVVRKEIKLAKILEDTAHLSPEIEKIHFHSAIPPDLDSIYADERQLRQVMTNLLLNAHEATATNENTKKIIVTARNLTLEKENQFSLEDGKYVHISVIDNGRGIPPELLGKIFDPYFSTKDTVSQKGLGMGLAICYSIAKKHDGHIAITSEVEKGTTVDLYLPVFNNQPSIQ
ncbi:tetratricopeptide repeat protein [Acidobacteriota bacterium]